MLRLTYLYLLRVPLIVAALLAGFPLFAMFTGAGSSLFQNLFDLTPSGTAWLSFAAAILAWSILLTANTIVFNARERFHIPPLASLASLSPWRVVGVQTLAVPVLLPQLLSHGEFRYGGCFSGQGACLPFVASAAAGFAAAWIVAALALYFAILTAPPGLDLGQFPAPAWYHGLLARANAVHVLPASWIAALQTRAVRLPPGVRRGFLNRAGLPWSGHWLALVFAGATFVIYKAIDWYQVAHLGAPARLPAILFVLWLFLNANWALGLLSFVLDRFRIPLLLPLALACAVGSQMASSDHYFEIREGVSLRQVRPVDVIRNRMALPSKPPIVLVATAGGGIQAAAWTARVLSGLQKKSLEWKRGTSRADFAGDLALVSSVSGGATGAMFFLNQYRSDRRRFGLAADRLDDIVKMAESPGLDAVAWALVCHDIPRLYWPYSLFGQTERRIDRGRMLEETWKSRDRIGAYLSNWREGVPEGWRPAAIFNATVAETGEPFLLSTTDLGSERAPHAGMHGCYPTTDQDRNLTTPERRSFHDCYPDSDLPVVTAVRLAATFPFVSPAARADTGLPEVHLVDGGYYDNYGVASLVQWLVEAFEGLGEQDLPPVLVIQIRSFPDDQLRIPAPKSAVFQLYAPVEAMLGARTTAQLVRDRDDLTRLQHRWKRKDGAPVIQTATFQFLGQDAPLSWAMNRSQTDSIDSQWKKFTDSPCDRNLGNQACETAIVQCFIDPRAAATETCADLRVRKGAW